MHQSTKRSGSSKGSAKGQCSRTAHTCPLQSCCKLHVGRSIARHRRNVKPASRHFGQAIAEMLGVFPPDDLRTPLRPRRYPDLVRLTLSHAADRTPADVRPMIDAAVADLPLAAHI